MFQFKVRATDTATEPRSRESNVYVRFIRDRSPRFDNLPREQSVSENARNNSLVFTVSGRDDDKVVSLVTPRCVVSHYAAATLLASWIRRACRAATFCSYRDSSSVSSSYSLLAS